MADPPGSQLNILLVADVSVANVIGGAERILFEQSTRLARKGHAVHILTRKLPLHKAHHEVVQGVKEWRYDVDQKNAFLFIRSTRVNAKHLFESLHEKYNFDRINFYQPFSAFGVVQSSLCKKIKKIYTCLSLSSEEFASRNIKPDKLLERTLYYLNILARKRIEHKILKTSDQIIVLSEYTQETLWNVHNLNSHNVSIIPGGIDLERFKPASDRIAIRRHLNIPDDKLILFSVRNLVQRMGLQNLILALKHVIRKAADVYLVLGGEGPLKDELIALARRHSLNDYIRFVGFIPEGQLPRYYQMADFFILPTRELEGFGLVTLEALASGIPVLGTPVGGTKEILGQFDSKFLFQDTTPDSIATMILEHYYKMKAAPFTWIDISQRCRQFVERHYSWGKNVDSLEKLLIGLAA